MGFERWSQLNKESLGELRPDFGFRNWNNLSENDKSIIWKHLEKYFFNKNRTFNRNNPFAGNDGMGYEFLGPFEIQSINSQRISYTVDGLNHLFKAKSYARTFLEDRSWDAACFDFHSIFMKQSENVVLELLSIYAEKAIKEDKEPLYKDQNESEKNFIKRKEELNWYRFDQFAYDLNEVLSHFGLNIYLTRLGFSPKQDEKISQELVDPVLKLLSHTQWNEVNQNLSDAFLEYRKNTEQGFSNCVTNTVTAVQAFLQILVTGKTGKGEISKLILQAQAKNLIPSDLFSKEIFKNIESILMKERQETGIAHPKKEYATEKNARMVLNLAMIFFHHCL